MSWAYMYTLPGGTTGGCCDTHDRIIIVLEHQSGIWIWDEDFDLLMPRVDTSCRFRSPARAEDVLEIGIAVESITARRINYGFEIRESVTRRLVAAGGYQVACVNRGTFKAIEFPAELRDLFKRMDEVIREQRRDGGQRSAGWT